MNIPFTSRQKTIISSAITGLALFTLLALITVAFWGVVLFISKFSSVFLPLATAGILSLLLRPVYQFFMKNWRMPPAVAVGVILLLLMLPAFLIFGVFGGLLVSQLNQMVTSIPETWSSLQAWVVENAPAVQQMLNRLGGWDQIQSFVMGQTENLLNLAAGGAQGVMSFAGSLVGLFSWAVLPVYLIFLLIAPPFPLDKIGEFLPFLKKDHRDDVVFLIRQFVEIVVAFFRGQLLIAFAQGGLMAVGFSMVGLSYGFILGLLLGILNLVPYLGSLIGLMITIPLAWFQPEGGLGLLIGVLVVMGIVQVVESYVLTPKIMGKSTGLHPMAVIFAMFFWGTALSGIIGLILAIPLTAFLVVFWRLAKEKYLPKIKEITVEADSSEEAQEPGL
ncbi:AI-2E family transporter [Kiritimatiellota bacterium B12222]|nr:AI-2E family transporter [Kiritimatiellota bacterium B12222]